MKLIPSLFCLAASLLTTSYTVAQNLEKEPFQNLTGTIKAAAPGAVQVAVTEKEVWVIHIDDTIKQQDIVFSGTAEKAFLRPGMFVEFRAQVNKRGMVLEPVASLTVFTPSEARPPGVLPDGEAGGGGGALFGDPKEGKEKPEPKKAAAKPKGDDTIYRVAGAISKVGRAGDVTVTAGGAQVKFNLAEECKITVDVNELAYVAPGDKAVVQGSSVKGQPGEGIASKIEITASKPLTDGTKKKPTKPVKEPKTPAKGGKGDKGAKGDKGDKEEKPAEEKKEEAKKDGDKKGAEKLDAKP
jgi:hypothetical protein